MFCDVNLYTGCIMIVPGPLREASRINWLYVLQLSSGFSFARNSSRAPCVLASFSHARMPRSACTRDVTCELYCIQCNSRQNHMILSALLRLYEQ